MSKISFLPDAYTLETWVGYAVIAYVAVAALAYALAWLERLIYPDTRGK